MTRPRIRTVCLVTPGHVSSTPRLVKEADALADAGLRVHVVAGQHFAPAVSLDQHVVVSARWAFTPVRPVRGTRGVMAKLFRRAARRRIAQPRATDPLLAARALQPAFRQFVAEAAATQADYYIGHCVGGIAAAALAARQCGVQFGADLEDFHDAETHAAIADAAERNGRRILQRTLLPRARHLTAAAPLIADAYRREYDVSAEVVLNAFPRSHAPAQPVQPAEISENRPAAIYWFSQTIGPGRGLEEAVAILGGLRTPVELHLRGFGHPDYLAALRRRAAEAGMIRPLRILAPAMPCEMARLASTADLGLSTELSQPVNRDLCLTNKVFVYLLAGIPQFLSATSGQTAFAPRLGDAAVLGALADRTASAALLDAFFNDVGRRERSRTAAWRLAHEHFCWDVEKERFLAVVHAAIGTREGSHAG